MKGGNESAKYSWQQVDHKGYTHSMTGGYNQLDINEAARLHYIIVNNSA